MYYRIVYNFIEFCPTYLKCSRQRKQLIHQRSCHAYLSFRAGMQTVISRIIEINQLFFHHRIQSGYRIKINHGDSPHIAGFFNSLHVGIHIFATTILVVFIRFTFVSPKLTSERCNGVSNTICLSGKSCFSLFIPMFIRPFTCFHPL